MITSLSIKNYALIEKLSIDFSKGFSIITGETGAGKSIILGALGLVLGKRADLTSLKNKEEKMAITYVELLPLTGRTHQLRVHCKVMRHPIIDDDLYGPEGKPQLVGRTALHAFKLSFASVKKGPQTVECPIPEDFAKGLAKLTKV